MLTKLLFVILAIAAGVDVAFQRATNQGLFKAIGVGRRCSSTCSWPSPVVDCAMMPTVASSKSRRTTPRPSSFSPVKPRWLTPTVTVLVILAHIGVILLL